jgi:hypothetical protein
VAETTKRRRAKKRQKPLRLNGIGSAPHRNRTCNLWFRRQAAVSRKALCPNELRTRSQMCRIQRNGKNAGE